MKTAISAIALSVALVGCATAQPRATAQNHLIPECAAAHAEHDAISREFEAELNRCIAAGEDERLVGPDSAYCPRDTDLLRYSAATRAATACARAGQLPPDPRTATDRSKRIITKIDTWRRLLDAQERYLQTRNEFERALLERRDTHRGRAARARLEAMEGQQ